MLVASYNPGYQNILKTLKPSTRQRFLALEFDFPEPAREIEIVTRESDLDRDRVTALVRLAGKIWPQGAGSGRGRLDPARGLCRRPDPTGHGRRPRHRGGNDQTAQR